MRPIIEVRIEFTRRLINNLTSPIVRDHAIAKLMIWRHGPKDLLTVNQCLQELEKMKKEAKNVTDMQFYLAQIDAYETLREHLKIL
jgi:hypothetical protein